MKKIKISIAVLLSSVTLISQTGCFGEFPLTRKVYEFNARVGGRLVQELVFIAFCIIPVYELAGTVDVFILNLIEFWTGSNPMSMNDGDMEQGIFKRDGNTYLLTVTKNKYNVKITEGKDAGKEVDVVYNSEKSKWSLTTDNKTVDLVQINKQNGDVTFFAGSKGYVFNMYENDLAYIKNVMTSETFALK